MDNDFFSDGDGQREQAGGSGFLVVSELGVRLNNDMSSGVNANLELLRFHHEAVLAALRDLREELA